MHRAFYKEMDRFSLCWACWGFAHLGFKVGGCTRRIHVWMCCPWKSTSVSPCEQGQGRGRQWVCVAGNDALEKVYIATAVRAVLVSGHEMAWFSHCTLVV